MESAKKSYDIPKFKEQYEKLHRRRVDAPKSGEYFDCISPVDGKSFTKIARSNELDIEAGDRRGARGFSNLGQNLSDGAQQHPSQNSRPNGAEPRPAGPLRNLGQRQADPRNDRPPICRWRSIIFAISRALSGPKKAARRSSIKTRSRSSSRSRLAWSARSSRGTSLC
jgi:hypothetical protein